ncbi:MAG: hypothetical protein CMJ75_21450 [Planctomycetaceae bacterium]|nr:hypothetical protein [Planctomycetaceae bacterium]
MTNDTPVELTLGWQTHQTKTRQTTGLRWCRNLGWQETLTIKTDNDSILQVSICRADLNRL